MRVQRAYKTELDLNDWQVTVCRQHAGAAGINNVSLVATVPEARQRGYGAALTWRATLADPTLPSLLLATQEGRPVYERIGYLTLFRFMLWVRDRSSTAHSHP